MNINSSNCRIISLLCLFYSGIILGQTIQLPKNIQSPNASSLGKYGDIPINYYSGRVDVNVPLFSDEENGIPLSIDLNYDSGGVRVNELPSWIGQNWNMNAGGVITRTQKGTAVDEYINLVPSTNSGKGYYYNLGKLNVPNWTDTNYLTDVSTNETLKNDLEPDIFNFNFMGITGKFFLMSDGTWKVQSSKNIKVIINMSDQVVILGKNTIFPPNDYEYAPKCIGKITLIDENGNQYVFGETQNSIEYGQKDFFDYKKGIVANAWYLTTVKDRLNNIIYSLEYERGDFQAFLYYNYSAKTREKSNNGTFWQPGGGCYYSDPSPLIDLYGTLTFPSYLKKITTQNGIIIDFNRSISDHKFYDLNDYSGYPIFSAFMAIENSFNGNSFNFDQYFIKENLHEFYHDDNGNLIYNNTGLHWTGYVMQKIKYYKLDNISIKVNNVNLKTITLLRNSTNERLNLLGVDILDGTSTSPTKYQFSYNNFNLLPSFLSYAVDHWGYYRGTNPIIPGSTIFSDTDYYNSRETNPNYLTIGSLKRITYPTKGFSEFEYEPHNYSKYVNDDLNLANESNIAGGLRIKKITTNDGYNQTVKEIKYTESINSNISSGILAIKNRYSNNDWYTRGTQGSLYREWIFSTSNIVTGSNFSGSHIGYSKVHEINNTNGGFITYEYTDYQDYPDIPFTSTISLSHSVFDAHNSKDYKRGHLKNIMYYDYSTTPFLLKKVENTYEIIGSIKSVRGYNYNQFAPCLFYVGGVLTGSGEGVLLGNAYEIDYSDFKLTSTVETDYLSGNTISKTTSQTNVIYPTDATFYGNTFLKSETVQTNRSGGTKTIQYNYPFDFTGTIESNMISKHFFPVIETISSRFGSPITRNKNIYQLIATNTAFPSQTYPMVTSSQMAKNEDTYQTDIVIDKYDKDGNILQYHKDGGINNSFVFSNNLLIYKLENATWNEYTPTTNFTTFNSNPTKKATKYSYNLYRNIESITHPNGIIEKYLYDTNNRLEKILDQNDKVLKKFEYHLK